MSTQSYIERIVISVPFNIPVSPMGKIRKRSWDTNEVEIVTRMFSKHLQNKTLPSTPDCYKAIKNHSVLQGRTVAQLKSWISNQFKKTTIKRKTFTRGKDI